MPVYTGRQHECDGNADTPDQFGIAKPFLELLTQSINKSRSN